MASLHNIAFVTKGEQDEDAGTGSGFGRAVLICAGVAALIACLLTAISTYLQAKNYRKPLLQRHVMRIFIMVPIFSLASWTSLTSRRVAFWVDPFRDVYEAFVLYTFFQLLVNFLGGERSLIIMMHGRPPVSHLWPLNKVPGMEKVDISDPHTFLNIKRGILQYAYIKPFLAVATIAMKATGTFQEGIISWDSGYLWTGIIYNISICWSLYDLALFWVCMSDDLQPFRPMPKFLCIKGIIFASWWQGFFLSILVGLNFITKDQSSYTADNLAAAIQDALICFEMPLFAISHWYAFSWKDYADRTISDARMPMRFALRDAFGPRDLIEDAKETWSGHKYEYRYFDAEDNVISHEDSTSRTARMAEGMRYERGGRGKYWLPPSHGNEAGAKQPLLGQYMNSNARTISPGGGNKDPERRKTNGMAGYGYDYGTTMEPEEPELDVEEERYYRKARELEFGDWNYPVINTHYATRTDRLRQDPNMITATTNRSILQPTRENRQRRRDRIKDIQEDVHQHDKPRSSSSPSSSDNQNQVSATMTKGKQRLREALPFVRNPSSASTSSSKNSRSSQLVDLVVQDHEAEAIERVRARKEGGPGWNSIEQKHFVKTFPGESEAEEVRQGFNPDEPERGQMDEEDHGLMGALEGREGHGDSGAAVVDESGVDQVGVEQPWEERRVGDDDDAHQGVDGVGGEERRAWGG